MAKNLPDARFNYDMLRVAGGLGLLSWSARASNDARTCYGTDSFLVEDGKIVAQTIHYQVRHG